MNRKHIFSLATVLFVVYLVASAQPVAAANTAVVEGGNHTTDADFENATLTNMTVSGTGTSASAVASTGGSDIDITNTSSTGGTETFQLGDYDSVTSGPAIHLTGVMNEEWDNESWSSLSGDITRNIDVAGEYQPAGPSANGKPQMKVTAGQYPELEEAVVDLQGDGSTDTEAIFLGDGGDDSTYDGWVQIQPSDNFTIKNITVNIGQAYGADYDPDASIDIESMSDGSVTTVKSGWDPSWSEGHQTVSLDTLYEVSSGEKYRVHFKTGRTDNDGNADRLFLAYDSSGTDEWMELAVASEGYADIKYGGSKTLSELNVSSDTGETLSFGPFSEGETKTAEFPISLSTSEVSLSGTNGVSFDAKLQFKERVGTRDPGVELNGINKTHDGVLGDGNTTTLTWDDTDLNKNGDNTVDVSLPDLSADAPEMLVDYTFETTTTKTWPTAEYVSANYSLANVTKMQIDVEMSNADGTFYVEKWTGSSWSTVTSTSITTNGTHTLDPPTISDSNTVRARVTFEETASNPYAELKSDTAFFEAHGAEATITDPPDNADVNDEDVTVSADIEDYEFDDPQGDNVTAEIYWRGSLEKTVTDITSPTTVSLSKTDLTDGTYEWHVETTDSYGVTKTLPIQSFDVNHYSPDLDNASASPTGGISDPDTQFTIDVADIDFAETSGDTVTLDLVVDDSTVGSDTLTSNGTASVDYTIPTGGDHAYYWEATDEYGQTTTSETFSVSTPSNIRIYEETNPGKLVDNVTVNITMYDDNEVYTRSTPNGTISMEGIPIDEGMIVVANGPQYHNRRIFVPSVYEAQRLYLLSENATSVPVIYHLADKSGDFPAATSRLQIEKALNVSNETQWQIISGDYFAADTTFHASLVKNDRYRLIVTNDQGDSRVLGSYIPTEATETTLTIGKVQWDIPDSTSPRANASIEGTDLYAFYNDPNDSTGAVEVHVRNETTTIYQATTYDTQTLQSHILLEQNQSKDDLTIWINATRSGEDLSWTNQVGEVEDIPIAMDQQLLEAILQIGLLAIGGLVAGVFPRRGGVVLVVGAVGAAWFGWWTIHPAALGIAAVIAFASAATVTGGGY
jgi:hypothetical protein